MISPIKIGTTKKQSTPYTKKSNSKRSGSKKTALEVMNSHIIRKNSLFEDVQINSSGILEDDLSQEKEPHVTPNKTAVEYT
jgi:hypothetical protein